MSGYTKECIYCHEKIRLSNDTGKWLPYGLDGTSHECRDSKKPFKQQSEQPQPQPQIKITLTLESLDQRITKLEELFGKRISKIKNLLFAIEGLIKLGYYTGENEGPDYDDYPESEKQDRFACKYVGMEFRLLEQANGRRTGICHPARYLVKSSGPYVL